MATPRKRRRGAFTLIEVLLVLVIITVIASLSVTAYSKIEQNARERAAKAKIDALKTPLKLYSMDVGGYPSTQEGLDALSQPPASLQFPEKWKGPYSDAVMPILDPWNNPYQYEFPGQHVQGEPDLWSFGPDGMNGTEDDIGSWTP